MPPIRCRGAASVAIAEANEGEEQQAADGKKRSAAALLKAIARVAESARVADLAEDAEIDDCGQSAERAASTIRNSRAERSTPRRLHIEFDTVRWQEIETTV